MAISFIDNALSGTTDSTTLNITTPATLAGDLLLLEYTHRSTGTGTIGGAGGSGWSTPRTTLYATDTFSVHLLWKAITVDTGAEAITVTGLTNSCAGVITHYRGTRVIADPIEAFLAESNASADETQAEIATLSAGAYVVLTVANSPDLAITSPACTSPGALTARAERLNTTGTDTSIAHASASKAAAGATGAFTWSQTNGASGSMGYAIMPLRNETIVTENLKVSGSGAVTLPLTAPLKVTDSVAAALVAAGGDLSRAVTDENLKGADGPVVAQETPLLATPADEGLHGTDGPPVGRLDPIIVGVAGEALHVTEGPGTGRLDPIIVGVTDEPLHVTEGPPVGRLDPISVGVADEPLRVADSASGWLDPLQVGVGAEGVKVTDSASGRHDPLQIGVGAEGVKATESASGQLDPIQAGASAEGIKVTESATADSGAALSATPSAETWHVRDGVSAAGPGERLRVTEGPPVGRLDPIIVGVAAEALRVSDAGGAGSSTTIQVGVAVEGVHVTEGPVPLMGDGGPLAVAVSAEALHVTEGAASGRLDPLQGGVTDEALHVTEDPPAAGLTTIGVGIVAEALRVTESLLGGQLDPLQCVVATENLHSGETASAQETPLLATAGPDTLHVTDGPPVGGSGLSRAVTAEGLHARDGIAVPDRGEALHVTDGPATAQVTMVAAPAANGLRITDAASAALTVLRATPSGEALHAEDQRPPQVTNGPTLLLTVVPEGLRLHEGVFEGTGERIGLSDSAPVGVRDDLSTGVSETIHAQDGIWDGSGGERIRLTAGPASPTRITTLAPVIAAERITLTDVGNGNDRELWGVLHVVDGPVQAVMAPNATPPPEGLRVSETATAAILPGVRSGATTGVSGGGSGTPTITLPPVINPGDTILVVFRSAVAGAVGWPVGWVELWDASVDAADDQFAAAWKLATGTEDGTTIQLTSGSGNYAACAWAIMSAADPTVTPPQLSAAATGTSATQPNSDLLTPAGGIDQYLWLSVCGMEGEATVPPSLYPASYGTSPLTASSGTAGAVTSNVIVSGAFRQARLSSDNPAAWTFAGTLDDWTAYTLAFSPLAAAPPPPSDLSRTVPAESVRVVDLNQGRTQLFGTVHVNDSDLRVEIDGTQGATVTAETVHVTETIQAAVDLVVTAQEVVELGWDTSSAAELSHEEGTRLDDADIRVALGVSPDITLGVEPEPLHVTDNVLVARGLDVGVTTEAGRLSDSVSVTRDLETGLITEALTGTESAAGQLGLLGLGAEALTLADGPIVAVLDLLASVAETGKLSDAVSAVRDLTATLTDGLRVTDGAIPALQLSVDVAEAVTLTDSVTPRMGLLATASEGLTISESASGTLHPLATTSTETVRLNDRDDLHAVRLESDQLVVFLSETGKLSDALTAIRDLSVSQAEGVHVTETLDRGFAQPLAPTVAVEALLLSDAVTARRDLEVAVVAEAVAVVDTNPVSLSGLVVSLADGLRVSEMVEALLDLLVTVTEALHVTEDLDRGFAEPLDAALADETLRLSEAPVTGDVVEVIAIDVTASDGLVVVDAIEVTRQDQTLTVEVDPERTHAAREDLLFLALDIDITPDEPPEHSISLIRFADELFNAPCNVVDEDFNAEMFEDESIAIQEG